MRLLLVEDSWELGKALMKRLSRDFVVDWVRDGQEGLTLATVNPYCLIILDVGLPTMCGIEVCRKIRARKIETPLLFLSGYNSTQNKIDGLEAGADDYLCKPFDILELQTRITALLRRKKAEACQVLRVGNITLLTKSHQVFYKKMLIHLEIKEYQLFAFLLKNAGKTVTKYMIWEQVWQRPENLSSNVVETYICKLRKKIDGRFGIDIIKTVSKTGYMIEKD